MRRWVDMCVWELKGRAGKVVTLKHPQTEHMTRGTGMSGKRTKDNGDRPPARSTTPFQLVTDTILLVMVNQSASLSAGRSVGRSLYIQAMAVYVFITSEKGVSQSVSQSAS